MLGFLLLLGSAEAGDRALYDRALALIDEHYLYPELVQPERMLHNAGRQLAGRIEWLVVRPEADGLDLRAGDGSWSAKVRLENAQDLSATLARVEDAVATAGLPLAPELDLRVELLRGVVKGLDRHSVVLAAQGLERFDERLSGTLTGIGVQIGIEAATMTVRTVVPGGPAERGGVRVGDVVLRIDGTSTVGMETADASERLRGPAGSMVVLTVRREGGVVDLTLVRDQVRLRNVTAERLPTGVGVVTVEHFSELTHDYLRQSLDELRAQDALRDGLVVDLRGNTGGSLIQSADAADFFLSSGTLVTTVGRDGGPVSGLVPRLEAQPDSVRYPMPIAVLMDHDTASGSEILAGSLAKLDRAILVGLNSFGKGTVQKVYQIDAAVKLKLTVAEYLVQGTQRVATVGLQPDVALSPVQFGPDGVWWADPVRERERLAPGTPVVHMAEERPGWRTSGMTPPERDAALDVTAALVAAADGPDRPDMLNSATLLARKLGAAEDALLVDTFGARGIDWSARAPGLPAPEPRVRVTLPPVEAAAGATIELSASVRNDGPDLHRAALRLRSVNGLWDDRVIPLGRLRPGEVGRGTTRVPVPWTIASRTDAVEVFLEAQDLPGTPVAQALLSTVGAPPPPLAVALRTSTEGDLLRVALELESRGDTPLQGVSARFRFPDQDGVELVEGGTEPVDLAGWDKVSRELHLRLAPTVPEAPLPLSLVISATGYGRLQEWEVALPRSGSQRLEAPTVAVRPSALVQAPGLATLSIRATDDRALDHVVVLGGPETADRSRWDTLVEWTPDKLAWKPALGRRADLSLPVEIAPGANRFEIVAQDRTGLRSSQTVYLLGDPSIATAAADSTE